MASEKRLGQLLQEKQEPFMLNVYLLERGCSKNMPADSATKLPNSFSMSMKVLKSINQSKKVIPNCSKIVRAVFNKLLVSIRNAADVDRNVSALETRKSSHETIEEDRNSSDSSTSNVFNSYFVSDADSPQNGQVDSDRKFQRRCMEDAKQQRSPISVLEDNLSSHNSPIYNGDLTFKAKSDKRRVNKRKEEVSTVCKIGTTRKMTDESIFSVALCKLLEQSPTEKPIQNIFSSEYIKIKLALQETKQLLFDCVREVIETYRWKKGKQQNVKEILGAKEIGNLLHENVLAWSKQTTDGTNTTKLLTMASFEEWGDLEQQRKEIAVVIGGYMSEDLIIEIVTEMVPSLHTVPHKFERTQFFFVFCLRCL